MNYQALGEYHAHKKQAEDAANKRFAVLYNLSTLARSLSADTEKAINADEIKAVIDEVAAAEREMTAAVARASEAAKLCGEQEITLRSLKR